jgi:hypothetical protein
MAGRLKLMGWRALSMVMVLVLIGHVLSLSWLSQQMAQLGSPGGLQRMAKPMFTRQITVQAPEPAAAPAPPVAPISKPNRPVARVKTAQAAIKKEANNDSTDPAKVPEASPPQPGTPEQTSTTLAQTEPEPTPQPSSSANTPTETQTTVTSITTTTGTTASSAQDPLARWPLDTRLSYKLSGNFRGELHGSGSVQWQRQGERYQTSVDLDIGPARVYHMLSQGRVTPNGLVPLAFEEKRLSGKLRVVRLQEDAVTLDNGNRLPRPPDLQDTASQFVALTYGFSTGTRRLGLGEVIRYHLARPGGVDEWVFDVAAEDTLYTARWGPVKAFHLKPRPLANPRGNIYAEIWFAPSLQYLPARIRITEGEIVLDLLVSQIEQAQASSVPAQTTPTAVLQPTQ